jgi:tetratricopeptide (TPR) repeat protein
MDDYRRANMLFQERKFAEAADALDQSLKEDPTYMAAWTLRGKIAMAFNRFDIARHAFLKAAALGPASAYSQFMLGFFYYVDNDFAKAVPALENAARLDAKDARPVLYLAMSNEGLAKPDLALTLYRKTIALEEAAGKPNPDTHTAYARLLLTLGREEESAVQVARVLELDPKSRDGHYERGRLLFDRGEYLEAAAEGETAFEQKGSGTTDRQIHFLLSRAYSKMGKKDLAELHRKQFEASPATLRR